MRITTPLDCLTRVACLTLAVSLGSVAESAAASTSIVIVSDAGDFIGQGKTYTETSADGPFQAQQWDGYLEIRFSHPTEPGNFWVLTFAAPIGQPLTIGVYHDARRFRSSLPGLNVSGQTRGCNTVQGSFEVREFVPGDGYSVQSFRATFEQHCDGQSPALRGEVRFNANVAVEVTAPLTLTAAAGQLVAFPVSATGSSGPIVLEAQGLPSGAQLVDQGSGTGQFTWQTSPSLPGQFTVTFAARNQAGQAESVSTRITLTPLNDAFAAALALPANGHVYGSIWGATAELVEPYHTGSPPRSVWFKFVATHSERIVIETVGATFRSAIAVYIDRTPLTPPSLPDLQWAAEGSAAPEQHDAKAILSTQAGRTYLIAVDGLDGLMGTFHLRRRRGELTRALWRHTSGAVSLWTVDTSGAIVASPQYGPFPGWEPLRLAVARDRTSRILWRHSTGMISLWSLDAVDAITGSVVFGPFAGWSPLDVSVTPDDAVHLSWRHDSGVLGQWVMREGAIESSATFGPYPGWHAVGVAAGSDAARRTLWRDEANTAGVWWEPSPYGSPMMAIAWSPGWVPVDVAGRPYNGSWILHRSSGAEYRLSSVQGADFFLAAQFGPFPGWELVSMASPNVEQLFDGEGARLLWRHPDGRVVFWRTDYLGRPLRSYAFGPYAGWTVVDLAVGPE